MATLMISSSLSVNPLLLISTPRSLSCSSYKRRSPTLAPVPCAVFRPLYRSRRRLGRAAAAADADATGDALSSEAVVEKAQQIAPASADDGISSTIVSSLLVAAFVGLSLLTIGVIYLAVQDFLQKRERDKFEKEEAANKKKGGKKTRIKARAGPRGFGQKIEEEDD